MNASTAGNELTSDLNDEGMQKLPEAVFKNIDTLMKYQQKHMDKLSPAEKVIHTIAEFAGSIQFIIIHVIWFGAWILLNLGIGGFPPFDPLPFSFLTLVVSLEAIFLSTFVLLSQNITSEEADRRARFDLHINLLAEREITRILRLSSAIAKKLDIDLGDAEEKELECDTDAALVMKELEKKDEATQASKKTDNEA